MVQNHIIFVSRPTMYHGCFMCHQYRGKPYMNVKFEDIMLYIRNTFAFADSGA
jgi:hypothetical protein